jgi:hypothetical protein
MIYNSDYNWCWISIVARKVESTFIIKYLNSIIQAYCFCVFFMEGTQNLWSPWYLMLEEKFGKVECKFCNNVIWYHKDRMFFVWAINMMVMDELKL